MLSVSHSTQAIAYTIFLSLTRLGRVSYILVLVVLGQLPC